VAISHYFSLQIWRLLQQNSPKKPFKQLACDLTKNVAENIRQKNTASKFLWIIAVFETKRNFLLFREVLFFLKWRNFTTWRICDF
jgi:hypothetical protein